MKINVKASGVQKLKRKIQSQAEHILNIKPFWQSVGMYIQKQTVKERFDKEQAPDGTKWKPLSRMTIALRLRRNKSGNMRILQDTGELRRSIKYEAGNNYIKVGSNLKYARIHQFGGTINVSKKMRGFMYHRGFYVGSRIRIPARPFLGVTSNERKHVNDMLRAYLRRHVFNGG